MRSTLPILLTLCILSSSAQAGEWPGWRRDSQRTAVASGKSDIDKPAARWRYFIGGALPAEQFVAHDLDGDKKQEVLFIGGGRLTAKEADDTLIWETKLLRLSYIRGLFDFNGDGSLEVLVLGKSGEAYLFRPSDGAVCWEAPAGTFTRIGAVLVGDLNGDKTPDLYLAELASSGAAGMAAAYSFSGTCGGGSKLTGTKLWSFTYTKNADKTADRDGTGGLWDVLADVDGDKVPEVVAPAGTHLHLYSGKTGKHLSKTQIGAALVGGAWTSPVDLDGDGASEVLLSTNRSQSRRLWVMEYDKTKKALVTRWERKAVNETTDTHGPVEDAAADLDGDGTLEVVTSFQESGSWVTYVLDGAASGTAKVKATVAGEYLAGLADLDGDGRAEVLTGTADGTTLKVRSMAKTGGTLGAARSIKAPAGGMAVVVPTLDRTRWAVRGLGRRVVPWDANRDKTADLLVQFVNSGTETLTAYDCSGKGGAPVKRANHAPGAGVKLQAFQPSSDVGEKGSGAQLLTPRSDGFLVSLGQGLAPTNSLGSGQYVRPGMRAGGFSGTAPLVVDLDGDKKVEVLTRDSRGKLLCLDPTDSNLVKAPKLKWSVPATNVISTRPAAADLDGDGKREVLVGEAPGALIVAYKADGSKLWSYPKNASAWTNRRMRASLLWGDVSGDKKVDVIYLTYSNTDNKVYMGALHGATGTPIWSSEVSHVYGGCGEGMQTLTDLDGDGVLDVVLAACRSLLGVRGTDGKVLNPQNIQKTITDKTPANLCGNTGGYAVISDLDGDGKAEAFATGNYNYACSFKPTWDGSKLTFKAHWTSATNTQYTATYAVPVSCGGTLGVRLVAPRRRSASLDLLAGKTGALVTTLTPKAGSLTGYLTSAAAHADLTGDGTPRVLLGSDDGHLYAVKPCAATPAIDWSLDMRTPVGEPVLGDVDGDGKDEILVASQDGYLNALGRERLPAPAYVYDNDGSGAATSATTEIDSTKSRTTLHANWAAVAGADGYEYAVITSFGSIITKPEFIKAGNKTEASASGLTLNPGERYFFAVRATSSKDKNSSAETISDGVLVLASATGDAGIPSGDGGATACPPCDEGCSCSTDGSGGGAPALLLLLALTLTLLRRRKESSI